MTPASRLLLDTHVFVWWRGEPSRLSPEVRNRIATADIVFVSAASAWEAAIKASLGRLELPDTVEAGVLASGFEKLLITFSHAEHAASLPQHHRDPFDRMLVAQARAEGLTLVTHDRLLEPYDVEILWA